MENTINLKVYKQDGSEVSTISLLKDIFGIKPNESVLFDAVQVYRSNSRQGTAKTKKRSEVAGTGKKPYRQKGTGRARAGDVKSPIWVGGGTVFGPDGNQNYKIKQNKKEHLLALKSALSIIAKENIIVLDNLKINGKTKEVVELLKTFKLNDKKVILVTSELQAILASGNIPGVITREYNNLSVYDLLNTEKLVITKEDIKKIEEELQ
ncbi:MAG: 50S ribosomal protein L4 [Bacillales bacterium]